MGQSVANSHSVTSGTELIAPILTESSATAFSSFGAVLSFSTSSGKEHKKQFLWVAEAAALGSLSFGETSSSNHCFVTGCGFSRMGWPRCQTERGYKNVPMSPCGTQTHL